MSTIRDEFEMLAAISGMSLKRNAAGNGYTETMTQMAWDFYQAATERAAKLCELQASSYAFIPDKYGEMACDDCAAAIRAKGGEAK